ncbi:MAG TPA: hypothetical protein PLB18_09330, partial [Acidobacteriota bacterium]|nr:hypothetical protein [Acidobacteriota bacterium]
MKNAVSIWFLVLGNQCFPRTKNQEPRTKNQEPRTKNQAHSSFPIQKGLADFNQHKGQVIVLWC